MHVRKLRESELALILATLATAAAILAWSLLAPSGGPGAPPKADAHGYHWVKCVGKSYRVGWPHLWVRKHDGTWAESYWGCMGHPIGAAWWQQFGDSGIGSVG